MRVVAVVLALAVVTSAHAGKHLKKPAPGRGFQTRVGAYTIGVGQDVEMCEYRRLSNKKAMDVTRFTLSMPPGAHHFALWTYGGAITDDSKFAKGPFESVGCVGAAPDELVPQLLIPTQSPNVDLKFPKGLALRIEPNQQVFLNPHMRNFGTETVTPDVRFNLYAAKKGSVKHHVEGLTFGNSTNIKIPAGGDQTLVVDWPTPIDLTLVQMSTHQHSRGTYAKVELVEADGVTRTLLVETFDWQHPPSVWPQGGLFLAKGRHLRLTCTWHNPEDHEVTFGPETTDEMCFAIGFFYRDEGDTTPVVGSGCIPSARGLLCPLAQAAKD
jgi:hypothetical protein